MNIASIAAPGRPSVGQPAAFQPAAPQPVEPRAVLRQVLTHALDATAAARVSTTTTAKLDPTQPFWVNRATRLCGAAQASMDAAAAVLQLLPGLRISPLVVSHLLDSAQQQITAAAEAALGSAERRAYVEKANVYFSLAWKQIDYALRKRLAP